ncbi:MAG: hypothetical protein OEP95_00540 [Myxococcales bacterium]|nr:hypothetical protein [Myxococcales bacterium]
MSRASRFLTWALALGLSGALLGLPAPVPEPLGVSAAEAAPRGAHRTGRRSARRHHGRHHRHDVRRTRRAVAITAIAIGTVARSLPRDCRIVVWHDVTYHSCGSTWYQPRYEGTTIVYVVVTEPY